MVSCKLLEFILVYTLVVNFMNISEPVCDVTYVDTSLQQPEPVCDQVNLCGVVDISDVKLLLRVMKIFI